jgi:chromosome segregation ATPase
MTLAEALKRLEAAIGTLEAAATRRLEAERGRADLETELALMQDDRARLAVELDGTLARLNNLQAVTEDVDRRLAQATGVVGALIAEARSEPR